MSPHKILFALALGLMLAACGDKPSAQTAEADAAAVADTAQAAADAAVATADADADAEEVAADVDAAETDATDGDNGN